MTTVDLKSSGMHSSISEQLTSFVREGNSISMHSLIRNVGKGSNRHDFVGDVLIILSKTDYITCPLKCKQRHSLCLRNQHILFIYIHIYYSYIKTMKFTWVYQIEAYCLHWLNPFPGFELFKSGLGRVGCFSTVAPDFL